VTVFTVADDRDPQTTLESIEREYAQGWKSWLENFEDEGRSFDHLLPFADFGTGDYYCFDYSQIGSEGELAIVHWSHETGDTELRASSFAEFAERIAAGAFETD
jgi:hypothetical protein